MMLHRTVWPALLLLSACTGGGGGAAAGNDAQRQAAQLEKQERAIQREAESNVSAIEQALENEGASVFANRADLLNETADTNAAAGNRSR